MSRRSRSHPHGRRPHPGPGDAEAREGQRTEDASPPAAEPQDASEEQATPTPDEIEALRKKAEERDEFRERFLRAVSRYAADKSGR